MREYVVLYRDSSDGPVKGRTMISVGGDDDDAVRAEAERIVHGRVVSIHEIARSVKP